MSDAPRDTQDLFPGKPFISTVLEALETKTTMAGVLGRRYVMRAAMAGILAALMYTAHFALVAGFDQVAVGPSSLGVLGKALGGLTFGWALVFIYYSRSELLTSNMMIVSIGAYHRRTTWGRAARLLGLCYLGNLVGGLLVALFLRFSTLAEGAVLDQMVSSVEHKLAYVAAGPVGWGDLLIRAVLCNFCINLAMLLVYNGLISNDVAKSAVMIVAVFIFAFLGLEHSVANTVLFSIVGLREGIDLGLAAGNVALALLGKNACAHSASTSSVSIALQTPGRCTFALIAMRSAISRSASPST